MTDDLGAFPEVMVTPQMLDAQVTLVVLEYMRDLPLWRLAYTIIRVRYFGFLNQFGPPREPPHE